ncbi:ABC transporter family protein [Blastomonas sp. RAC04]|uniref:ABC transporter ATP-binding protein n=1 Tax=Blastomonas sp. RAC04 TaxID=1842535 RepID=UPI00083E26A1|nr:ATP-binding cassette domain-containing protein [Blastomonas sp. RAC04]AOF99562.1 ABC transporter family protein [Blastomonas sp. RAC04]
MPDTPDTIELNAISHHFDTASERIELFKGLSCTIRADETLAIVGPSGAGKSSLLAIAAGLEEPAGGTVRFIIHGADVDAQAMRANSGFIFQQFHLMPELDAIGNLALPLRLKGNRDASDIAALWLEKVGLKDRARHRPHQLSGGEQQRIAVARAFITAPRFVFADEPTGNLDIHTSQAVAELMFDCAQATGCGLVIVTHSRQLAQRAGASLILAAGRLEEAA